MKFINSIGRICKSGSIFTSVIVIELGCQTCTADCQTACTGGCTGGGNSAEYDPSVNPAPELDNIGLGKDEKTGEEPNVKTGLVETTSDGKTHVPYYDADTGEYLGEMVYDPETGEWNGSVKNPATGKTTEIKNAKDDGKGDFTSGEKKTTDTSGGVIDSPANPTNTEDQSTYTPPGSNTPQPSGCS